MYSNSSQVIPPKRASTRKSRRKSLLMKEITNNNKQASRMKLDFEEQNWWSQLNKKRHVKLILHCKSSGNIPHFRSSTVTRSLSKRISHYCLKWTINSKKLFDLCFRPFRPYRKGSSWQKRTFHLGRLTLFLKTRGTWNREKVRDHLY